MGTEVWLPLQFTEAGRVPYFMWWLCTSRGCVFLPPTLPFFCSVSLEWKQFLFPFRVCYFFWGFSSNSPALEKGYLPEGVSLDMALHGWEADGRVVPVILHLLALNQRMQYQFSAGSVVDTAVLVQPQPSPEMPVKFWEMDVFQQFPTFGMSAGSLCSFLCWIWKTP